MTKVLVADDSETILLLLRTRLEMEGYEVVTAIDGQEVVEALAGAGPGSQPDEREPVQHPDRLDRVARDHSPLLQRPAQIVLADAAAPAMVDEQLHRPRGGGAVSVCRPGALRTAPRAGRMLEPLLGRLPGADPDVGLALDARDLAALARGHQGPRGARPPDPPPGPDA